MHTNISLPHRTALVQVGMMISRVTDTELSRPTPCLGWDLCDLLEHMVGQNHGFAAAVHGHGPDLAEWLPRELGPDLARTWQVSADLVHSAFELADVDVHVELAEFRPPQPFPLPAAQSFHFLDTVIHGWDIAAALGVPYPCDRETADLVVRVATRIPAAAEDRGADRPFRAVLNLPEGAAPLDHALALTGRDPAWSAAAAGRSERSVG
jgi:uncharacterized protein (TIGR03086 family)